ALTRCSTIRLPLQPTGWPRLIAPPSTFILVWSICPAAPSRPRISLQNFSSFQAAKQPSTWVANASFNSQVSMSPSVNMLRLSRGIRPHAIVVVVEFAVAGKRCLDLAFQPALRLRIRQPLVAFGGIGIGLGAVDAEEMPDHFGGLAHVKLSDRIGQAAFKPD